MGFLSHEASIPDSCHTVRFFLLFALVGLNSQIVTQATYAIVVFMTTVTTVLAPPLLRYLFRKEAKQILAEGHGHS